MEDRTHQVNVSTTTILKIVLVLLVIWFLFAIREILLLLLISIIISSAIDPLADYLHKKRIPRGLSVFFVYILVVGMFGLIVYLMVPPISQQFHDLAQSDVYDNINSKLGVFRDSLDRFGIGESIENNVRAWASNISQTLFNAGRGLINGLLSTLTVLVVSFYLTAEENGMKNLVKQLVPFKNQAYAMGLVTKIQKKTGHWVLGQLILSLVIFGLTFLGLSLFKVNFALVLALIAGVLEVVPYIGPFISLIPAAFFAFLQNPPLALVVIILYTVIQQLENHIIVPVVMSKSTGLNPVVVILGILIGGTLGGIVGGVLAVPVISAISVFVEDMWGGEA
jgi:predicted PurR-regulated permease PerM